MSFNNTAHITIKFSQGMQKALITIAINTLTPRVELTHFSNKKQLCMRPTAYA